MRLKSLPACGAAALALACSGPAAQAAKFEPAGNVVYHGASLPETWSENGLARQYRAYKAVAGKRLSVITWFASVYENGRMTSWRQNYAPVLARVKRVGAISLIKFSTQDYAYQKTRKNASTRQIARGVYDAYFAEAAAAVKEFGAPVFISINHEMNGNWYPYSQAYPGSGVTANDYVGAWRRIVDIFRRKGASNAAFVWSPNVPDVGGVPYTRYYPGDGYVDWVGVSFYSGNSMDAMDGIYRAYSARKPFFITEWATAPEKSRYYTGYPGDPAWVSQVFQSLVTRYPRVKAISWFNWNKDDGNYLLQRVPDQARTYAGNVAAARYLAAPTASNPRGSVERARLDRPASEVVLHEAAGAGRPRLQSTPRVRPRQERIRLQVVPSRR